MKPRTSFTMMTSPVPLDFSRSVTQNLMNMQELKYGSPLGDENQPFDWINPHLFISSITGNSRTLIWPHSSRCCVYGQDQSLIQRIYNYDATAFPLLLLTLITSNNVLFALQHWFPKLNVRLQFLLVKRWGLL